MEQSKEYLSNALVVIKILILVKLYRRLLQVPLAIDQ